MARPLRIEYAGAWYHVMNRGRRGETIFSDGKDFEAFLVVLQESAEIFGAQVAAYCLMTNHYHLLLHTPNGNLSRVMRHINGIYTQRYNRRHKQDGQLFRGRYKCIIVEGDSYLLELLRYIHRNPIRAKLAGAIDEYPWSSHYGYLSGAKKWEWLYKRFLLAMFSEKPRRAKKAYLDFVTLEDSKEVMDFFKKKNLPSIFGSEDFISWIKGKYYLKKKDDEVPESRKLAPTVDKIKKEVCRIYKIGEDALLDAKRGQINEPRNIAIYLARKLRGMKLMEIGSVFGMAKYSSVSSVIARTKLQLSQDVKFRKKIQRIESNINKSQRWT